MAPAVYILCVLTSAACAVLLLRAYLRRRTRVLLWSSLCFVGLLANNMLLVLDLLVFPGADLANWRTGSAVVGLLLLLYGLIWDMD